MNHKVLLADDSLTIQKVIKITLANQPYDITEVSSEDDLFHQLPVIQPKLVFLDFNLSERYTGYELTTKIKSISPATKVLLLLGTFDSVDEAAMEKCGASDKIVKPFDSNKFIAICKQMIETFADDEIPYPEVKEESFMPESSDDQWEVNHSVEQNFSAPEKEIDKSLPDIQNPLQKEVSDWGMSVPGVINESSDESSIELPPVIGEIKSLDAHRAQKTDSKEEAKYPETDDLDYPTIEELNSASKSETESESSKPASKLLSIDSFNDRPAGLEIEGNYVADDSDVKSIEDQIRDEVEEDLWKADEFEDLKKEVSSKIEDVKNNFQPTRNDFDESLFKPLDDAESIEWETDKAEHKEASSQESAFNIPSSGPQLDMSELRSEMEKMVQKYVKEYMDELFQKNTEKVVWEVIPDLAENLIRQELSKISNKILND